MSVPADERPSYESVVIFIEKELTLQWGSVVCDLQSIRPRSERHVNRRLSVDDNRRHKARRCSSGTVTSDPTAESEN